MIHKNIDKGLSYAHDLDTYLWSIIIASCNICIIKTKKLGCQILSYKCGEYAFICYPYCAN